MGPGVEGGSTLLSHLGIALVLQPGQHRPSLKNKKKTKQTTKQQQLCTKYFLLLLQAYLNPLFLYFNPTSLTTLASVSLRNLKLSGINGPKCALPSSLYKLTTMPILSFPLSLQSQDISQPTLPLVPLIPRIVYTFCLCFFPFMISVPSIPQKFFSVRGLFEILVDGRK